jgi:hypothetical protein
LPQLAGQKGAKVLDAAQTVTSEQRLADAAARLTSDQQRDQGFWTEARVPSDTGEVHIAHGPAFNCFLGIGWCDCCTCSECREREESIGEYLDLLDD